MVTCVDHSSAGGHEGLGLGCAVVERVAPRAQGVSLQRSYSGMTEPSYRASGTPAAPSPDTIALEPGTHERNDAEAQLASSTRRNSSCPSSRSAVRRRPEVGRVTADQLRVVQFAVRQAARQRRDPREAAFVEPTSTRAASDAPGSRSDRGTAPPSPPTRAALRARREPATSTARCGDVAYRAWPRPWCPLTSWMGTILRATSRSGRQGEFTARSRRSVPAVGKKKART
jgi:hypothetical protein